MTDVGAHGHRFSSALQIGIYYESLVGNVEDMVREEDVMKRVKLQNHKKNFQIGSQSVALSSAFGDLPQ